MTGKIKTLVPDRGFGFITADQKDYFFHRTGCVTRFDSLRVGDSVTFEPQAHEKGLRAADVEYTRS